MFLATGALLPSVAETQADSSPHLLSLVASPAGQPEGKGVWMTLVASCGPGLEVEDITSARFALAITSLLTTPDCEGGWEILAVFPGRRGNFRK